MSSNAIESLKALPLAERIQLVEDLWDSIALTQQDLGLTEPQQRELERRLDAIDGGQSPLAPWSEVKNKILSGR